MADEFATVVTVLEVKDAKYKAQLKAAEAVTTQSAAKMQSSMSGITIGAGQATAGISALGGAAALTGNQSVNAAAQLGTLLASLGPLGPIAIGIGVAIGALTLAWKLFSSAQAKATEEMEKARSEMEQTAAALRPLQERIAALRGATQEQILVTRQLALVSEIRAGKLGRTDERRQEIGKEFFLLEKMIPLLKEEVQIKLGLAEVESRRGLEAVEAARRDAERLSREQFLLQLQEKGFALRRVAAREAIAERKAETAARQADVRAGLTGGRAPVTAGEAKSQLIQASTLLDKQNASRVLLLQAAQALAATGFDSKSLRAVLTGMGIVFGDAKAALVGTVGSVSAAAFRGRTNIAAPNIVPAKVEADQRDKKRNTLLGNIERVLDKLLLKPAGAGIGE